MGYSRAGFEVVGVDIKPQPHYPFYYEVGDALEFLANGWQGSDFDAIHASPPCQRWTRFQTSQPRRENHHPDLIAPTRSLLGALGIPWVIENVPGSPLRGPVQVCGTWFGLEAERGRLWRHRWFESSWPIDGTPCFHDTRPAVMVAGHGKDGYRGSGLSVAEAREAMQIDWMNRDELAEAIPPAYTEWVGVQLMQHLNAERTRLPVDPLLSAGLRAEGR
jgi:DNA (cytosine-5)-methyltransferase 1